LALTVSEGSVDGLRQQGRPKTKSQWMDDIEEWSGCSYIQLKEMSQDREQWRRKTIEWSSAVANRQRQWSTSESVRVMSGMFFVLPLWRNNVDMVSVNRFYGNTELNKMR